MGMVGMIHMNGSRFCKSFGLLLMERMMKGSKVSGFGKMGGCSEMGIGCGQWA